MDWFATPTVSGLQQPLTPVPGDLPHSSSLCRQLLAHRAHTHSHKNTPKKVWRTKKETFAEKLLIHLNVSSVTKASFSLFKMAGTPLLLRSQFHGSLGQEFCGEFLIPFPVRSINQTKSETGMSVSILESQGQLGLHSTNLQSRPGMFDMHRKLLRLQYGICNPHPSQDPFHWDFK